MGVSLFVVVGSTDNKKNGLSCVSCAQQRSLHPILVYFPTTAGSAQFCLLCCQPEPVPRSLAARLSQLTSRDPCRLQAWLGQAFCIVCRTCTVPPHFKPIIPKATESRDSPVNFLNLPVLWASKNGSHMGDRVGSHGRDRTFGRNLTSKSGAHPPHFMSTER